MRHVATFLAVKSFAKLNLYLQVLNKRKDNFHNLSTLFARIDLADTIILRKRKDGLIKIKCDSRKVPKDKSNLCYRAAALLKEELKLSQGIEIELKKRIPVGAGLGGGSSNGASVLLGLNKLWNLNLAKTRLAKFGAKLGSDVPFFIYQTKFALGNGRGDQVKPINSLAKLKLWFILVYPNFKVSTPLIYREFDLRLAAVKNLRLTRPRYNVHKLISQLSRNGRRVDASYFLNELEVVTTVLYPIVGKVKAAFFNLGLEKAMMSGSGPAVFAICNSGIQAKNLSSRLNKKHKTWQFFVTSTV